MSTVFVELSWFLCMHDEFIIGYFRYDEVVVGLMQLFVPIRNLDMLGLESG